MGPRLDCPSLPAETADKRLSYVGTLADCVLTSWGGSLKVGAEGRAGPGSRVSTGGGSLVVTNGISGAWGGTSIGIGAGIGTGAGDGGGAGGGGYRVFTTWKTAT
jgi:hypothetical protein